MDTQPKIPTLKDSQKPQVKIRGLEAGVTLFDRLKQFKKKDLAFILAGLGTLFMAPLAEHFMMSPDSGDANALHQGWGKSGSDGGGIFNGGGGSPYEPGTTGLAPGSAIGGGSDIITPLNVRDPSALVMGPGSTQQPPTNSVMPGTPPPTAPVSHSDSDLKDALAASAAGVGAAAHAAKALLPIPHIALAGSGLHGLGAVSGGTSAVANSNVPNSQGLVSGRAAQNSSLGGVRPTSGYKGVARGQTGGDTTGMDALKKAAGDAGSALNRGSASSGLNEAANTAIPTNTGGALGGGGAGGTGATDKAFGGDQSKDGKNVGESLAFEKQKKIQDAQIALWSKEQEAGDNKLEALKLRNTMMESIAGTVATGIGNKVNCIFDMTADGCPSAPSATSYNCVSSPAAGAKGVAPISGVKGSYQKACGSNPSAKTTQAPGVYLDSDGNIEDCSHHILGYNCTTGGTPPDGGKDGQGGIVDGMGGVGGMSGSPMTDLGDACTALLSLQGNLKGLPASEQGGAVAATQASVTTLLDQGLQLVTIRDAIGSSRATGSGIPVSGDCQTTKPLAGLRGTVPVASQMNAIINTGSSSLLLKATGITDRMTGAVTATDPKNPDLTQLNTDVTDAQKGVVKNIDTLVSDVATLQGAYQKLNSAILSAPDPLGLEALHAQLKNWDQSVADKAKAGESAIQASARTTGTTITNLNTAANTDLVPLKPLLTASVGTSGTLQSLVTNNKSLDAVGGPNTTGMTVPAPLKAPALTAPQNPSDGTVGSMNSDLANVPAHITDATTKVAAFKTAAATTPDPDCKSAACTDAQTALNLAGTDVAKIRADQTAINGIITKGATAAGGVVSLAPVPAH